MDEKVKATQSYSRVCEALGDENIKESSGTEGLEFYLFRILNWFSLLLGSTSSHQHKARTTARPVNNDITPLGLPVPRFLNFIIHA